MIATNKESGKILSYVRLLSTTELFEDIDTHLLQEVLKFADEEKYEENQIIFASNDVADSLYIIVDGQVIIEKEINGTLTHVAQYTSSELFGESGIFLGMNRNAQARSLSQCRLIRFPAHGITFPTLLQDIPEATYELLNRIISRLTNRIRSINGLIRKNSRWITELRAQLMCDKLTGLHNMLSFKEEYIPLLQKSKLFSIVVLKPTNFKKINDAYGHDIGDAVLHRFGTLIIDNLKNSGVGFRYLGSEMAIVFNEVKIQDALRITQKIVDIISHTDHSSVGTDTDTFLSIQFVGCEYGAQSKHIEDALEATHKVLMQEFKREE